jgi:hypothetical protein
MGPDYFETLNIRSNSSDAYPGGMWRPGRNADITQQ